MAVHELDFLRTLTTAPIKVALPGPYLLTRTMWMDCIADSVYATREQIAADIVRVLREELMPTCWTPARRWSSSTSRCCPRWCSAGRRTSAASCAARCRSRPGPSTSWVSRSELVNAVVAGLPRERIALHVCRGNWTPDESVALAGSYAPLIPTLAGMKVGAYLLEACTPRAGDMALLQQLPADARIGVGVVNQKHAAIEPVDAIAAQHRAGEGAVRRRAAAAAPRLRLRHLCRQPDLLDAGGRGQAGGDRAGGAAAGLMAGCAQG
jgi:5-methyltetrahydropteroyltriglutamate--homocysteine methyltransferase